MAAAYLAGNYDGSSTHAFRLGDCILGELGLRRGKPRRNRVGVEDPEHAWVRGFAAALSEVYRLLLNGNHAKEICAIARASNVDLAVLQDAGVCPYDVRALKRAGIT